MNKQTERTVHVFRFLLVAFPLLWSWAPISAESSSPSVLFVNAGWRGLLHEDLLDSRYVASMKERGFLVDVCHMKELDRERLFQFNVAVLLWLPPETHEDSVAAFRTRLPLVREYVESGGGLFFNYTESGTSIVYERTYHRLANEFFEPLGLRAIPEVVRDPKNSFQWRGGMREHFIRTKNIAEHAITSGVDEFFVPTHWWDQNSFKADTNWNLLVQIEASGYLTRDVDAPAIATTHRIGTIDSAPPVVAAREVGKGRVVFDTVCPVFTISDGYHYMNGGLILEQGGALRLHQQAFEWLSEPSLRSGTPGGFKGPSYTPAADEKIEYTDVKVFPIKNPGGPTLVRNLRSFLGLYGAHSDLTDGKASVKAFAERARSLGYDYLVFTDPLELMTEDKYTRLVELCAEASSEDFLVLPGMEYSSDRLWSPVVEQPSSGFGENLSGRGHGRPRFLITYLNRWVGHKMKLTRKDPLYRNYPLSPDGSYVLDNGIIYVSNGTPRQCLLHPKKAGVGPWHVVLYNGFATHSYHGRSLIDDSLDWYLDRVGNDYRVTPMTYHRILSPENIPALGETFVSATRAAKLADLDPKGRGLIYPWRNQNYVTSGPRIDLYGVVFSDGRPRDYLVIREQEWKCYFEVSSEVGLAEVRVLDGTRTFRRFALNGEKTFSGVVTGHHDQQHYITVHVRDKNGGLAVSGPQVVHGWRHWYGMSGADLISCNDSTYQVGSNGKLDFAWCTGGVLAGGSQIGPRLNVQHEEITPIARDAHSPRMNGRVGVLIDTNEGREESLNRLDMHFANEEVTILDQMHEHHAEPGFSPTQNTIARARVRWHSFTPRLYDWNLLLVDTEVEILRDVTLREAEGGLIPRLATLTYAPNEIPTMDHYAIQSGADEPEVREWKPEGVGDEQSPFRNRKLPAGGYVGLYPGTTAGLVVYSLDGNAEVSMINSTLRFGRGRGGEKLEKGQRFSFRYLVGLKFQIGQDAPKSFEALRRIYGLDGSEPCYGVELEQGQVLSRVYTLRMRARDHRVIGSVSSCPDMPSDLPLVLEGLQDRWNVSLYDYDRGTIKRVGVRDGVAYSAIDINVSDRKVFFGHPFVCQDQRVYLELHGVEGAEPGEAKFARVEVHNPSVDDLDLILKSPLFGTETSVRVAAGSTRELSVPLEGWTDRRVTIFTNELSDQLKRRKTTFK